MEYRTVRVIAAAFHDDQAAEHVLRQLREMYQLRGSDAQLAPLGDGGSESGPATLLAGRFYDERAPSVRELIEREGGRVVIDVDEAATRRRITPGAGSRIDEVRAEPSRLRDPGELSRIFF